MGFRHPLTTSSGVDTGGAGQRVKITAVGGTQGGGAVELYPNTTNSPGLLEAGTEAEIGPVVRLLSPPNTLGARSSLELAGTEDFLSDEGVTLNSTGAVYLRPETGKTISAGGTMTNGAGRGVTIGTFMAGWGVWTPNFGYEGLTFSRKPDGMITVSGLVKYTGTAGAPGTVDICVVAGVYVPKSGHVVLAANVNDARAGFVDVRTDGTLRLRGALPTPGTNVFVAIDGEYRGQDW